MGTREELEREFADWRIKRGVFSEKRASEIGHVKAPGFVVSMALRQAWILFLILCLTAACGKENPDFDSQEYPIRYVFAEGGLRLRSAPSLTSPRIVTIGPGSPVSILRAAQEERLVNGHPGHWMHVKTEAGEKGWVFGFYLTGTPPEYSPERTHFYMVWYQGRDTRNSTIGDCGNFYEEAGCIIGVFNARGEMLRKTGGVAPRGWLDETRFWTHEYYAEAVGGNSNIRLFSINNGKQQDVFSQSFSASEVEGEAKEYSICLLGQCAKIDVDSSKQSRIILYDKVIATENGNKLRVNPYLSDQGHPIGKVPHSFSLLLNEKKFTFELEEGRLVLKGR